MSVLLDTALQQPVECLGMTFPNDEARREHFLNKLRNKLKDPEFRKIEDFEGSGTGCANALGLEVELDTRLQPHWPERAKAIVIEPEVDVWMWGSDNVLRDAFRWEGPRRIRDWLRDQGYQFNDQEKPERPKEALEAVLRHCKLPRSSALYQEIASKVSLPRCVDPAFQRLRSQLMRWFPV